MQHIALTGGIASGKTLIGKLFRQHNITVIDSDDIARALLSHSGEPLDTLIKHFGTQILHPDNTLDRARLAEIIFNSPQQKSWLDQFLHPLIYQQLFQQLDNARSSYTISLIPLLLESHQQHKFDRVLVIDCDPQTQLKRLQQRNSLNRAQAQARIAAQATNSERLQIADDIIVNTQNTTIEQLQNRVAELHKKYSKAAGAKTGNQG